MKNSTRIRLLRNNVEFYANKMNNAYDKVRYLYKEKNLGNTPITLLREEVREAKRQLSKTVEQYEAAEEAYSKMIRNEWEAVQHDISGEVMHKAEARANKAEAVIRAIRDEVYRSSEDGDSARIETIAILVDNYKVQNNMSEQQEKDKTKADTFMDRLFEEKNELSDRANKLEEFIKSEKFKSVSDRQQILLHEQLFAMNRYLGLLIMRIDDIIESSKQTNSKKI